MTFCRAQARRETHASKFAAGLLCLVLFATLGCQRSAEISARETAALKTSLAAAAPPAALGKASDAKLWEQTRKFYELRQNKPAWIAAGKPQPAVRELTTVLAAAGREGLNPAEYEALIPDQLKKLKEASSASAAMETELLLTSTLLRYASHLALGRPIASQIDRNWTVTPRKIDVVAIVHEAVAGKDLETLPAKLVPPHPEYARLKNMLERYRKIAAEGKLQAIPAELNLKAGEPSPHLANLRNNLLILGDLQEKPRGDDNVFDEDLSKAGAEFAERSAAQPEKTPDPAKIAVIDTYDRNLAEAVRRFEARHGLDPDGVPDADMIAAMNVPPQARIRQIELNLERWRWMPEELGSPYVFVNVAGYRLQVRDGKEAVPLKMRVIVGKEANRTPIFSDVMTTIVFSPYWNIPQSIETKEMMPAIMKDSDYLTKKDIEVVQIVDGRSSVVDPTTIDWENPGEAGDFRLRQKPGAGNALGFVKFMFPNRHAVYLHDTPSDNLFDKLTRDLSHGCVRLEKPVELAAYVLRDQPEWTPERIKTAMHAQKEQHVSLKNPLPVHLVYLTARVDEDGVPQFFEDVYGYDLRQQELWGISPPPQTVAAHPAGES